MRVLPNVVHGLGVVQLELWVGYVTLGLDVVRSRTYVTSIERTMSGPCDDTFIDRRRGGTGSTC